MRVFLTIALVAGGVSIAGAQQARPVINGRLARAFLTQYGRHDSVIVP